MLEIFKRNTPEYILTSPIWGSSCFLRNNQICKKERFAPLSSKICFPTDLLEVTNEGMKFIDYDQLSSRYGTDINREQLIEVRYIIQESLMKRNLSLNTIVCSFPIKPSLLSNITIHEKGCNYWTKTLKSGRFDYNLIRQRERKWEQELGYTLSPFFWDKQYKQTSLINFDNKLKWLNYQIVRGTLKTNKIVSKFVHDIDENCSFCGLGIENISHLFWHCNMTFAFLSLSFRTLSTWPNIKVPTKKEFLFGMRNEKPSSSMNFLILYLKHYIWVTRCKKNILEFAGFMNYLKFEISVFKHCTDEFTNLNFIGSLDLDSLEPKDNG